MFKKAPNLCYFYLNWSPLLSFGVVKYRDKDETTNLKLYHLGFLLFFIHSLHLQTSHNGEIGFRN